MNGYYTPSWKYSELRATILKLLEKHGKTIRGTVLHVGSGEDNFRYKQYFPNAERYRCLDIKPLPNVDIVSDVQDMPEVPSNSEDCVIATFFLLLVPDVKAALKEIKRVVRPKGKVFLTFTNPNWKKFGRHKWTTEEALELLNGFFRKRKVHQSDIGIAVVASKEH